MTRVLSRTSFTSINTQKTSVTASAFFALVLAACQPSTKTNTPHEMTLEEAGELGAQLGREAAEEYKAKPDKLSAAEARKCANDGGTVRPDSLLGKEHCDFSLRLSDTERSNCKAKGGKRSGTRPSVTWSTARYSQQISARLAPRAAIVRKLAYPKRANAARFPRLDCLYSTRTETSWKVPLSDG